MKSSLLIISTLLISSCASSYRRSESIEEKMARFKSKNLGMNHVPKMSAAPVKLTRNSRRPASIKDESTKYSNKKLYFLALYKQYEKFAQFSQNETAPQITICPSFHTSLLNYKEQEGLINTNNKLKYIPTFSRADLDKEGSYSIYPEINLPMSMNDVRPTVSDYLKSNPTANIDQTVHQALRVHIKKTYHELKELCEYGNSDNYYSYENLITEEKRRHVLGPDQNGMNILLKTTVFSNMAILDSMLGSSKKVGRSIASKQKNTDGYTNILMDRLGVYWAKDYFKQVAKLRKN